MIRKTLDPSAASANWGAAVIKVGYGRGFVVEGGPRGRLVITAAHCLPALPPAHVSFFSVAERTCPRFLRPIGVKRKTVAAECIFADPVADLAVLGCPDDEVFHEWIYGYEELTRSCVALPIAELPADPSDGWLFTYHRMWAPCRLSHNGGGIQISGAIRGIRGGMSGSPILN